MFPGSKGEAVALMASALSSSWRVFIAGLQAIKGEEPNMVVMPRWNEEPHDTCIEQLVNVLLDITDGMSKTTDLRHYSQAISSSISKTAGVREPSAVNESGSKAELLEVAVARDERTRK
jgi:hypothetical protein